MKKKKKTIYILNQAGGALTYELAEAIGSAFPVFVVSGGMPMKLESNFHFVRTTCLNKASIGKKIYSWLKYICQVLILFKQVKRESVLIVSTNPPLAQLILPIARLLNVKVLFWVLDLYPDAVWCGTNIKEKNIVLSFWKLVNKCSFKKADFIISLSNTMIKETKKYLPSSDQNKFVQIPTWVDPEKFYPLDRKKNPLLTELNLAGKFIVLYSGNIGATHDLNFLPELANSLKSHKNIVFLIVGSGSGLKNLKRKACCCNNVAFLPPQPFESLNNLLSLGHIAIVSQKYGTGGVSMPSKTYYYMACGCAIMGVVPLDSGVKDVVREYKCGFCCGHADITKMKNFILNCRHKRSILEKFSNNSRLAVEKRFNLEKCSKKFIQLISRL